MWVPSIDCVTCTPTVNKYNPNLGGSNNTGDDVVITYLDGTEVKGYYYDTQVILNGLMIPSMRVMCANYYLSTQAGLQFVEAYDGMVGLAPAKLSGEEDLLMQALFEEKLVKEYIFVFSLKLENEESFLYFGGYDSSKIDDKSWMNLDGKKLDHWNVYFEKIFFDEKDKGIKIQNYESIVDSGTSLMYLPSDVHDTLLDKILSNIT